MPYSVPLFKDIGKSLKDLLSKKLDDEKDKGALFQGQVLKFKTKSDDGVSIDVYNRFKGSDVLSEVTAKSSVGKGLGDLTLKLDSTTAVELSFASSKILSSIYDGINSEFNLKHSMKNGKKSRAFTGDAKIKKDFFTYHKKWDLCLDSMNCTGDVSVAIGEDGLSVGAKYPFSMNMKDFSIKKPDSMEAAIDDLSLGVQLELKDLTCSLITKPKSELEMGFVQKVSSKTTVGGKFHVPKKGKDAPHTLTFGVNHKLDSDTTLYGVLQSTGGVKGTIAKKFADPKLTASVTFGMDLTKGTALSQPVGLAIALGDA